MVAKVKVCEICQKPEQDKIVSEIKKKEADPYLVCCFSCGKNYSFHTNKKDQSFVVGITISRVE